jgi:16S rRNA (adenine1518-N6/adenine1519-N6)-dimethyltransferase
MKRPPAKRSLGQNFLVDPGVVRRILQSVHEPPGGVVEIGPGHGALTAGLVARFPCVAAIELDRRLVAHLKNEFGEAGLVVHEADVLSIELSSLRDLMGGARLTVVGNLPYNISKPIAMLLVRERAEIDSAVLMFQREVAQRLTASAGTRAYGPLTVLAGACFTIERLFDVSPGAFRPRPGVVSTVTRWRSRPDPLPEAEETALRTCLAACFTRRRRTILNNLRNALGDGAARALLKRTGIDGASRAEQLPPDGLRELARQWPAPPV